jgi:predicted nucleic acid-binding protein
VVLRGLFPDEEGQAEAQSLIRAYAQEEVELLAPALLHYQVTSAILQGVRRDRIDLQTGREILTVIHALGIPTAEVPWQRALELAHAHDRPACDGAYLALAEETGDRLVTGDQRLHDAVKDHLPWVLWIGDLVS